MWCPEPKANQWTPCIIDRELIICTLGQNYIFIHVYGGGVGAGGVTGNFEIISLIREVNLPKSTID